MIKSLQNLIQTDGDYPHPDRVQRMKWLCSVLDGSLYDRLQYAFVEEREPSGKYVPIIERRPSVRYNICRIIANDSVSMLFSEGHFPRAQSDDPETATALEALIKDARLNEVMTEAAMMGSTGSVAILFRVLNNRAFFSPVCTTYLHPKWNQMAPDQLLSVTEQYKVRGDKLAAQGYDIPDDEQMSQFWFRRVWDAMSETWLVPWLVNSLDAGPQVDKNLSTIHGLGFVPIIWIRNLPGGDAVDGSCTFEPAIADQIEIEYQLSQAGRGLRYSSDPTLCIKEPAAMAGELHKGTDALILTKDGDAKLLEISGTACAAVIEYARTLREMALEVVGGNRANADKLSAAQSGRAMELMNQSLIWLADKLRTTYGEGALRDLLYMVAKAAQKFQLTNRHGRPIGKINLDAEISLKWPRWYHPTAEDRQQDAGTLNILRNAKLISQKTAVASISDDYDIENVECEINKIDVGDQVVMDRLSALSVAANDGGKEDGVMLPPIKDSQATA